VNYSDAVEMLETHDFRPIFESDDPNWDQFTYYFWISIYDFRGYLLNEITPQTGHKMSELLNLHITSIFQSLFILILDRLHQYDLAEKYQDKYF
jgi:hypothetical protein